MYRLFSIILINSFSTARNKKLTSLLTTKTKTESVENLFAKNKRSNCRVNEMLKTKKVALKEKPKKAFSRQQKEQYKKENVDFEKKKQIKLQKK